MKTLSIIIPTLNRADLVRQCLISLKENTTVSHEVVLVDDGSTEEEKRQFAELVVQGYIDTIITNDKNRGTAYSMNAGLRAATGTYIAIINNDILFTSNWENPLVTLLSEDIWVTSPLITEGALPSEFPNVALAKRMVNFLPVQGCCLVAKRALFEIIGYFPEDLKLWYCDNWLCYAVLAKGKRLVYVQDSYVHHFRSQTANTVAVPNLAAIVAQDKETYFSKYKLR